MGRVIGCDLTDKVAQISISIEKEEGEEVVSVPVITGSEKYVIPVLASIGAGVDDVLFGEDAARCEDPERTKVSSLISGALRDEAVTVGDVSIPCKELLRGFIRKSIHLSGSYAPYSEVERVVITIPEPLEDTVRLLEEVCDFLKEDGKNVRISGYPESFFYYAMNQEQELTRNKIALFDFDGQRLRSMMLSTRLDVRPHVSMVEERVFDMPGKDDGTFLEIARSILDSEIVSAVYLSGEGFEGGWLDRSVQYLCERRRRVFQGRNLYTKGACYAGIDDRDGNPQLSSCKFFDRDKVTSDVGIHIYEDGQETYLGLVYAGSNWYDAKRELEFMLGEDREIRIRIESYYTTEVRYSVIRAEEFPQRPDKCTRVRFCFEMKDTDLMEIEAYDLGFGEIYRSSGNVIKTRVYL